MKDQTSLSSSKIGSHNGIVTNRRIKSTKPITHTHASSATGIVASEMSKLCRSIFFKSIFVFFFITFLFIITY